MSDAFFSTAETATALLRDPGVARRWAQPSALPDFSVAGLARHLANQITRCVTLLTAPPAPAAIPLVQHYLRCPWLGTGLNAPDNVNIRHDGERAAAITTPTALATEVAAALAELRRLVPTIPPHHVVPYGDWGITRDDFLLTRIMELVVHTDDLATSLNIPTPPLPPAATDATIDLLARIATERHGPLSLIRALSRQERAPKTITAL